MSCGCNRTPCRCSRPSSIAIPRAGTGCCTPILPSCPTPFFAAVPSCEENHTQNVIYNQLSAAISPANSWNIPDCAGSAILSVSGLQAMLVGAYIWNGEFGYYEVIAFNPSTQQITVQNNCTEGNAEVGTQVPACSEFIIVAPPSDSGGTFAANGATPVVVANTSVTTESVIAVSVKTAGGTPGSVVSVVVSPGSGFTFTGTALDTSTYNYVITELIA